MKTYSIAGNCVVRQSLYFYAILERRLPNDIRSYPTEMSPSIVTVGKHMRLRWARHVARTEEIRIGLPVYIEFGQGKMVGNSRFWNRENEMEG